MTSPVLNVFRRKHSELHSLLLGTYDKARTLEAQLARRLTESQDLKSSGAVIQSDLRSAEEAMLKRLEAAAQPIMTRLEHESSYLKVRPRQLELENIERVVSLVRQSTPVGFLNSYRDISTTLETFSKRTMTHETEVDLSALPNEMGEILSAKVKHARMIKLNEAKNQVLWDLCRGRGNGDVNACVQREVLKWSRLTDKYMVRMAEVRMRCRFCDDRLSGTNVNLPCSLNAPGKTLASVARDVAIPPGIIGTSKHFWVNPNLDVIKRAKERIKKQLETSQLDPQTGKPKPTSHEGKATVVHQPYHDSHRSPALPQPAYDSYRSPALPQPSNATSTQDRAYRYIKVEESVDAPAFFDSFKSTTPKKGAEVVQKPAGANPYLNTSTYKSLNWSMDSRSKK
jgi:hypothetical protein